jgi:arylsulfatase A-like enzyme
MKSSRRIHLTLMLWGMFYAASGRASGAAPAAGETPARPNIVFILLDDLRANALSCTGHTFVKTPNIDRIGLEGAIFRNAFVTTPLCVPSRACFLTGQYAHKHGKGFGRDGNNDEGGRDLVTFPLLLRQSGYETAFFGKWHLGGGDDPRPGFDRSVTFKGQGEYVDPVISVDGKRSKIAGNVTDILSDHAVEFIQRRHDKPFLLYLSHKAVHAPYIPPPRHKDLFAEIPIVRAPSAQDNWEGKPVLRRPGVKLSPNDSDFQTSDENIRDQLRCLVAVDEGVKRIFDALEQTKQLDQTMIVFSSDNGYFWGEHDLGGKHGAYEESIRVPLMVRYPKLIKPKTTFDQLALSIDVAPTFLELGGVAAPDGTHGRSLMPLLGGETTGWRSSILTEFFLGNGTPRFPTWQSVRTARWKYIRYVQFPDMDELYDLHADRMEMKNLVHDPAAAKTLSEMKAALQRLLDETK